MEPFDIQPAKDLGLSPSERAQSLRRESGLIETCGHHAWRLFVHTYMATYHRLKVEGREHMPPEPPFILIANHASHLDALALACLVPARLCDRVFPISAADVFFNSSASASITVALINSLPMRRKGSPRHALSELRERLTEEPCGYILFPEGTRNSDEQMGVFKSGLGMLVAGTDVPVIPCRLRGTGRALRKGTRWPKPLPIRLAVGEPLNFQDVDNDRAGWDTVAQQAKESVQRL